MTETQDRFECAMYSENRFGDDEATWPESIRRAADGAVARLLADHPGKVVAEQRSYCLARGEERFDGSAPLGFALVREVRLGDAADV